MSEFSDDTDVLLLIPPDFFMIPDENLEEDIINLSKPSERQLVSDLISQVNDLEGRICMIENQNFAIMPSCGNLQRLRHFGSADTINTSSKVENSSRSLQTTPIKNNTLPSPYRSWRTEGNKSVTKYSHGVKQHPNLLTSFQYMNQREKDDQLLKEIHNFFKYKNVKRNIEMCDEYKSEGEEVDKVMLGISIGENVHLSKAVLNLNKVNDLLKQLEETQAEIEQKLKIKGINGAESEENINTDFSNISPLNPIKVSIENSKSNKILEKVPTEGLNSDHSKEKEIELNICRKEEEELKPLVDPSNNQKDLNEMITNNNDINNVESKLEIQTTSGELSDLLSLCKLWGSSKKFDEMKPDEQKVLKQKYEEEKYRRQHCEELIQKLHARLLEEQQKIAVAIKVDKEKDEAISKLSDGWNKLVGHWKELENQKINLGKKLISEREKFQSEVSAACQTVKRYEIELSKALDLAHGYKEKCEISEKERKNVTVNAGKEIENLKRELHITSEKLNRERNQTEKLEKLMAAKEESITQVKSKVFDMQNQIRDLKKNIKDQHTELEGVKHEKDKLLEKLKEEKNRILVLEQNKKSLSQSNEELKKKEKSLKENLKSMTEQIEKIKADLKEFYQEQVEKIVQEKLKEFQEQLAKAEKTLQKEIEERERKVTEMAVKQVQQIVEKHVVEVNLIEEKHNQEIELWKVKVLEAEDKVRELQRKLEYYSSQKTEIAQKLQNIMETQWQEALKIITASSPQHPKKAPDSGRSDPHKDLTRQNTFTMLSHGLGEGEQNKNELPEETVSPSDSPEIPFCKDAQLTYREHPKCVIAKQYRIDETPQKIEAVSNDSLKNYIQMLLERPPGAPVDESPDKSLDAFLYKGVSDNSTLVHWQHILSESSSQVNSEITKPEFLKALKEMENVLPWK